MPQKNNIPNDLEGAYLQSDGFYYKTDSVLIDEDFQPIFLRYKNGKWRPTMIHVGLGNSTESDYIKVLKNNEIHLAKKAQTYKL